MDQNNMNVKRSKKLIFIGIVAVVSIALIILLIGIVRTAVINNRVRSYLDGKVYISEGEEWSGATIFKGSKMYHESWCSSDQSKSGSLDEALSYKVKKIGDTLQLWYKEDGKWWSGETIVLNKDGSVEFKDKDKRLSTMDEINAVRTVVLCKHEFAEDVVTKEATCASGGEKVHECKKCGYTVTESISALDHTYENKVCTVCGAEKQPEIVRDLKANTWYVYNNTLYYQNCALFKVESGSHSSILVTYKSVCQDCHGACDTTSLVKLTATADPYEGIYTCSYCDATTIIKLRIGSGE